MRSRVHRHFHALGDLQVLELPPGGDVPAHLDAYRRSGLVAFAEPDYYVTPALTPNDPGFVNGDQWHLRNVGQSGGTPGADIHAVDAWDTLSAATNVIVAMIDTGLLATHEDLVPNLWTNPGEIPGNGIDDDGDGIVDDVHGLNAFANTGNIADPIGHGTMVAGFIGAAANNGFGVAGVAWKVQLMMCRYIDDAGNGSVSDIIQCFDYARTKGAKVINASFVSTVYSSALHTAMSNCRTAGIVIVAAAGNTASNNDVTPAYPGSDTLDNVIAVAATDRFDALASYSSYGATSVDLGAPGSEIMSTTSWANDGYGSSSGTSFSTAIVSGAMALMRARYPSDTPAQLIQRVLSAVDPLPSLAGKCLSGGRLNLARALGPSVIASFSSSPSSGEPPLAVQFTDTSFGTLAQWAWDFGDGATSAEQNPLHTFSTAGDYTVTLTATGANGHSSSTNQVISVVANYHFSSGTYSWVDPSGMTALSVPQNGVSAAQPLPFTFTFYGQPYSTVYVAANGMLGFNPTSLGIASNTDIPNAGIPNNLIAPFWDALNPLAGSAIRVGTVGAAPNRRYVVSWVGISTTGTRVTTVTFQALLFEGSNEILFQYLDVAPASRSASAAGKAATIGLEDASGLIASRYSYNGSTLIANNSAILFTPPSAVTASGALGLLPAGGVVSSGPVGGPFSPATQSYTLTNSGTGTLSWTASATQGWVGLSATSGSLAAGASTTVTVSIAAGANALAAGSYSDTVTFANTSNGVGNTTRTVGLTVIGSGALGLLPAGGVVSSGPVGGPFTPATQSYTLTNSGTGTLSWTASATQGWVGLSATSGSLAAGASTTVTVSIKAAANALAAGSYSDTVTFANTSNGVGTTSRGVSLRVLRIPVLSFAPGVAEGSLLIQIHGDAGVSYILQKTSDFQSWRSVSTNLAGADGTVTFAEPSSTGVGFFRALLGP